WLLRLPARGARRFRVEFSARKRDQVRAVSAIRAVDAWDQVDLQDTTKVLTPAGATIRSDAPHAEAPPLRLVSESGDTATGFEACQRLFYGVRLLQPLAPLAWLLGKTGLGSAITKKNYAPVPTSKHSRNGLHANETDRVSR